MKTYDDICELIEELNDYTQWLAPSYDELPDKTAERIENHLRKALEIMKKADYMMENVV